MSLEIAHDSLDGVCLLLQNLDLSLDVSFLVVEQAEDVIRGLLDEDLPHHVGDLLPLIRGQTELLHVVGGIAEGDQLALLGLHVVLDVLQPLVVSRKLVDLLLILQGNVNILVRSWASHYNYLMTLVV